MLGLKTDFVQNDRTMMILDREQGIRADELNEVQLGMIRSSSIPHFLKLHIKEVDYKITMEYDITGKKMLSQALKAERMSLTEYYGLLLQIVTALHDSSLYMLKAENFILHEDYIFIAGSLRLGTLYLTYLPLETTDESGQLRSSLKECMTRLLASVTELKGRGVQALMSFCGEQSFSLPGLKRLILELLAGEDDGVISGQTDTRPELSVSEPGIRTVRSSVLNSGSTSPNSGNDQAGAWSRTGQEAPVDRSNLIRSIHSAGHSGMERPERIDKPIRPRFGAASWLPDRNEESAEPEDPEQSSPLRTYILLACMLAAAAVWRLLYLSRPSLLTLGLSAGITILLAAAAWLGWQGKLQTLFRRTDPWSGALPAMESTELEHYGPSAWKAPPRFQADPLSGLLNGGEHIHREDRLDDRKTLDSKEKWRWKSPRTDTEADEGSNQNVETPFHGGVSLRGGIGASGFTDRGIEPGSSPAGQSQSPTNDQGQSMAGRNKEAYKILEMYSQPGASSSSQGCGNAEAAAGEEDYYAHLSEHTEILSSSGDGGTVLLSQGFVPGRHPLRHAYLEVRSPEGGVPERVEINQPHFIIGRSAEVAQYVALGVGTSRAHAELSRGAEGYVLKDLGSRNGTVLEGEAMVPYKEYAIAEGNAFIIAGWSFTFRSSLDGSGGSMHVSARAFK
ncbi:MULTISPECIES: DUF6382 domain-containing protein [Paenibacillus]|uniref:DUF6382 domain-containing protein n=1 Tax=Paenibacillus TaxID=44249 RepID=UPI0004B68A56|nr:DUF6382 domain-containing protein [Paenibacillus sp. IHBB 10380]